MNGYHRVGWAQALGGSAQAFAWPPHAGDAVEPHLRGWLATYEARVSRFQPDSDTSLLNRQAGRTVPVGDELRDTIAASMWAADLTGGIVDPLVGEPLRRAGYASSRTRGPEVDMRTAERPPDRLAEPSPDPVGERLRMTGEGAAVAPGHSYDPGGVGKGLACDRLLHLLRSAGATAALVDLAGDLAATSDGQRWPVRVDPYDDGDVVMEIELSSGAVATSGITRRVWRDGDGRLQHHLRCPRTGEPVFGPWVAVTARAPTCLEAEVRAKWAYLTGDPGPLAHGGLALDWRGRVHEFAGAPT